MAKKDYKNFLPIMNKFLKVLGKILDKTRTILLIFCFLVILVPLIIIVIIALCFEGLFTKGHKNDFYDYDDEEY